jgi:prepilin-type N-terminal cleavage/methylation domain-containing protein
MGVGMSLDGNGTPNREGRMRGHDGFTLVELLVVIVIIGILAAIAIPRFSNSKEKAYLASMKADLKNLITAEEAYFYDKTAYTTSLPAISYNTSAGVTGPNITLNGRDFSAWVGHSQTARTCAVYLGTVVQAPATKEGEPKCS